MKENTKYIAVTIDNNYVQHCGTMLVSLFENNSDDNFLIFVIHNGISSSDKNKLSKQVAIYNQLIEFIEIDESIIKHAPVSCHVSLATYYRILLPDVLPDYVTKVLFLDCDIIVRAPIGYLWSDLTKDYSHLASENPMSEEKKQRLGMSSYSKYFNAGVLLINLQYWRERKIKEQALNFIANNPDKIVFWDQDVLNAVLENQWKKISYLWNAQEFFFREDFDAFKIGIPDDYYQAIQSNPYIIHFTGSSKPWFREVEHPFKNEYLHYLSKSLWAGSPLKTFAVKQKSNIVQAIKNKLKNVWNSWGFTQSER
ncbi:MAG: glycosyltransferase family 8 protein [Raineya sp.]